MQTIKIIINDGKVQSVEISKMEENITQKDIESMLKELPKEMLAKALGITDGEKEATSGA